ncbi:hypothetical protein PILCRDRAFT_15782 [Piloderma croceum F 1598]|uniref:Uncharacterized protein n=1 Tax=Piloderma croceum (strain F 1598) TaxID=765440 RepID=A0A0C3EXV6_PILCF|nr:hypothetical protein PILCRDRAFT_15782 [Piloderma croceum F 1598]
MSRERLIYALLEVKEILDDLPAIEPGASQGTHSENQNIDELFEDLLKDATNKGYARRARADIQDPENTEPEEDEPGASPNSQPDDEEEEDPQPVTKVDKLVRGFLKHKRRNAMHPAETLDLLTAQPIQVRSQQERDAFVRILAGIEWHDEDVWYLHCEPYVVEQHVSFDAHRMASTICDKVTDVTARLHRRHELIDTYTSNIVSERMVHTMLIKVDWVRFADDYNGLSFGQKTVWLKEGYMRANMEQFAGLNPTETKTKFSELDDDFKRWKKKVGNDTTARNRLYELFLEYGAMIILDPTWNIQALRAHSGANSHKALLRLKSRLPDHQNQDGEPIHALAPFQPAIEHALVCIVSKLAGPEAGAYVDEFLDSFTPEIRIPRLNGYD